MKKLSTILGVLLLIASVSFNSCKKNDTTPAVTPVVVSPAMAHNNSPVEIGHALKLYADTVKGASYSWTGPNSFRSSSQNPVILSFSKAYDGDYTVTTIINGVASAAYHTYVTDMEITASSDSSQITTSIFTTGNTMDLTASNILDYKNQVIGAIYKWTGPNSFTSSLQNPTIGGKVPLTMAAAGTYSVIAIINGGNDTSKPATVTVTIRPAAPKLTATSATVGGTLNLKATPVTGILASDTLYRWTGPNGFTSKVQNPTIPNITRAYTGTYTCYTINNAKDSIRSITASIYVNINFSQNGCNGLKYVFDKSGTFYLVTTIGNQCWMQSDLNDVHTNYTNTYFTWAGAAGPAGVAPQQGTCPVGWHLPNDSMFNSLIQNVGSGNITGFQSPAGFAATFINKMGAYWSVTGSNGSNADYLNLDQMGNLISIKFRSQSDSIQVRCLKD